MIMVWILSGWASCAIAYGILIASSHHAIPFGFWFIMALTGIVDGAVAGPFCAIVIPLVLYLTHHSP